MELPGMGDPKEVFGQVSVALKQKFDDCGMGAVDDFVDKLDQVKDMVEKGPAELILKMKKELEGLKAKIEFLAADPTSLVGDGPMKSCAGWYGRSVSKKLGEFNAEVNGTVGIIEALVAELAEPIKKLGDTLASSTEVLEGTIKKLAKLPAEVSQLASGISGAEDVAKIEMDPMKKCLDVGGISGALEGLAGLKPILVDAVTAVKNGVQRILDFLKDSPSKLTDAFKVPCPCCCMTGMVLSKAPAALTQLQTMVEGMKLLDLNPVIGGFESVSTTIVNLDIATVTEPVNKFAEQAGTSVDQLDKVVCAAKLASGGAAGGLLAQVKGMF